MSENTSSGVEVQYPPMWKIECEACKATFYSCYPAVACGCGSNDLKFTDMDYHDPEQCEVCEYLSYECGLGECADCGYQGCDCQCHLEVIIERMDQDRQEVYRRR